MIEPNEIKSPFKFLLPYNAEDTEIFFGRDKEVEKLYELLMATNIVLVYGPSGTGKTSLVQCGLNKRFNGPDWIPLIIRRQNDFNESLYNILKSIAQDKISVPEMVIDIYEKYFRPTYLIFDQFEEIFTLTRDGERNEKGQLIEVVKLFETINALSQLPCKIIIVLREEFLGQLYNYEENLPSIYDFRVRVEQMTPLKIKEVVEKTFRNRRFRIKGDTQEVVRRLSEGHATANLAYLQVYLDRLWKEAYVNLIDKSDYINIDSNIIAAVGSVNEVLQKYFIEQRDQIANKLGTSVLEITRLLVDNFIVENGNYFSKKPVEIDKIKNPIHIQILNELKSSNARLIKDDEKFYELAHDALAGIISRSQPDNYKAIRRLVRNLGEEYEDYLKNDKSPDWLAKNSRIVQYDTFKKGIEEEINDTNKILGIRDFIEQSRLKIENEKKELEEKNRMLIIQQAELNDNQIELDVIREKLNNRELILNETSAIITRNKQIQKKGFYLIFLSIFLSLSFLIYIIVLLMETETLKEEAKISKDTALIKAREAIDASISYKIIDYSNVINRANQILQDTKYKDCPSNADLRIINQIVINCAKPEFIRNKDFMGFKIKVDSLQKKLRLHQCIK